MFEDGSILNDLFLERLNYFIYVVLLLIGLHAMISKNNFIKKLIGMCVFQTAIILFHVSIGVKEGATIPIYLPEHDPHGEQAYAAGGPEALAVEQVASYANPLPHVLMLTAIVVGVATLGFGLGFVPKNLPRLRHGGGRRAHGQARKGGCRQSQTQRRCYGQNRVQAQASVSSQGGARNPAGKTTAVQAKKSSGPRKSNAPAGKARPRRLRERPSGRKESPNDGKCDRMDLAFPSFRCGCRCSFRNGQPESLLADRGTLHDGFFRGRGVDPASGD